MPQKNAKPGQQTWKIASEANTDSAHASKIVWAIPEEAATQVTIC